MNNSKPVAVKISPLAGKPATPTMLVDVPRPDSFLVMAHGAAEEMARARAILGTANPSRRDVHAGVKALEPADHLVQAGG